MEKQLIFIDDSGDPGIVSSPSEYLFMAAIVFETARDAESAGIAMSNYRNELGWNDRHEFKFRKNPKSVISSCLKLVRKCAFSIYVVYLDKKELVYSPIINLAKLNDFLIGELLDIIPIGQNVKISIDGKVDKSTANRKIAQLRRKLNLSREKRIAIKYEDSAENNLIQLADLVAGSINRSFKPEKTDSDTYIKVIKDKIVRIKQIKL